MSKPLPYEEEKAMRLWMRLHGTGGKTPTDSEKIAIIQRAIEEVVRDVKSDCRPLHESDSSLAAIQRAALKQIHEMAAEDLRVERVFVCHSFLSQIEATSRAALNPTLNES
jgi:hypothetical protein